MIDLSAVRVRAKFFFEGERKFFIKGVTYGPFAPDDAGDHFGSHEGAVRDLDMMLEVGVNLVRIYYVPPCWFLDLCAERGIRILAKGYDSSWSVIVVVSLTSAGPKYWMAPGKA